MQTINYLLKLLWVSFTVFCYLTVFSMIWERIKSPGIEYIGFPWPYYHQFCVDDNHHGFYFGYVFYDILTSIGIGIIYLEIRKRLRK